MSNSIKGTERKGREQEAALGSCLILGAGERKRKVDLVAVTRRCCGSQVALDS